MNAQQVKRWSDPRGHCSCSWGNLDDGGHVDIDDDVCIISNVIDDTDYDDVRLSTMTLKCEILNYYISIHYPGFGRNILKLMGTLRKLIVGSQEVLV